MAAKSKKIYQQESFSRYAAGFRKIGSCLKGIEWLTAILLYALWAFSVSFWLQLIFSRWFRASLIVEVYVAGSVAITAAAWWGMPTLPLAALCSYFLLSTLVVMLHVVLLSKVFGDIESAERSLILFICNVAQLVFTFAIWYELKATQTKDAALFNALLVFATVGYPLEAPAVVVGAQIATDFLLLAIFLAHIVGRVGYRQGDTAISQGEITRQTVIREIRKLKE